MLAKIIMPSGGQTTNESLIVEWHKRVGDAVNKGDVLFDIETDKAIMEVESYADGKLLGIKYRDGEYASTGDVVAYVGDDRDKLPDEFVAAAIQGDDEYQPIASPAARHLAKNHTISLSDVAKSTAGKTLKKADIENYIRNGEKQIAEEYIIVDTTAMRKVIAGRMAESMATAPQYQVSLDIDMSSAIELRQFLNEHLKDSGIKVSFNDLIIKCAAKAIEKHPMINSSYEGSRIKVYKNVNFGLAVGLDDGLVVPVARQVNQKSLSAIARENAENIKKAKENKLQVEDLSGGTMTLSNLGMYGVDHFTAIINQPESCILAIGGIIEKAVVVNGQIVPRPMMTITATFDHRVIDGAEGAAFLRDVRVLLEKPQLLMI